MLQTRALSRRPGRAAEVHLTLTSPATPSSTPRSGIITHADREALAERLFKSSEFLRDFAARSPDTFAAILDGLGQPPRHLLPAIPEDADSQTVARALRRYRNAAQAETLVRDLLGFAPLTETLARLTQTAEHTIRAALKAATREVAQSAGYLYANDPRGDVDATAGSTPAWMTVIAMGKLGAGELNFSSDIDLIFVYRETEATSDGRRQLVAQQWYERVSRALVRLLGERTPDGFCYRVDLRLRPFGDSGPVVVSLAALEQYLLVHGRDWERYAMIKARPVCGDPATILELSRLIRPFVYRRYLDFSAISSLREMKEMIGREVRRAGLERDIKRGRGGIREIEFIGQVFQLMRGGQEPNLRARSIVEVLNLIGGRGLLDAQDLKDLKQAYRLLRTVENRLQGIRDEQVHALPTSSAEQARLASAMGAADWSEVEASTDRARANVARVFDALLGDAEQSTEDDAVDEAGRITLARVAEAEAGDPTRLASALAALGFDNPQAIIARITTELSGGFRARLSQEAQGRLDDVLHALLATVAESEAPEQTLARTLKFIVAVSRRSVYLSALKEFPKALRRVVKLFAASPWIAEEVTRHPGLLDELLDSGQLYQTRDRAGLVAALDAALARLEVTDEERTMDALRRYTHSQRLRIAASDITAHIPVNRVSDFLTEIAEVVVERTLKLAWDLMVARHGRPLVNGREVGVTVVGYGKLGGYELGYSSDLDLVFVHDDHPPSLETDGARPIDAGRFFARLAQRFIHFLSTATIAGKAYEIDLRLRPSGNSGLMVVSAAGFERYQLEEAWTWEHQALIRARPVAGSRSSKARFADIRTRVLTRTREADTLREEVLSMREKMRANLDRSSATQFDLKQGRGGVTDLEFMVQYLVLKGAATTPELTRFTDNWRLLDALAGCGQIDRSLASSLVDAYFKLRARGHQIALLGGASLVPADELISVREAIVEAWAQVFEQPVIRHR